MNSFDLDICLLSQAMVLVSNHCHWGVEHENCATGLKLDCQNDDNGDSICGKVAPIW